MNYIDNMISIKAITIIRKTYMKNRIIILSAILLTLAINIAKPIQSAPTPNRFISEFDQTSDSNKQSTLFHEALETKDSQAVSYMLSKGINPDSLDKVKSTPLQKICSKHHSEIESYSEIIQALLERGANTKKPDSSGNAPLHSIY